MIQYIHQYVQLPFVVYRVIVATTCAPANVGINVSAIVDSSALPAKVTLALSTLHVAAAIDLVDQDTTILVGTRTVFSQ